jgi:acetyltransferase-like isoleucine patch superfamily enzyme
MLLIDKEALFINNNDIPNDDFIKQTSIFRTLRETDRIRTGVTCENNVDISSYLLGEGKIFIGAYTYMNDGGYIRCEGGTFIGRYCSIGRRVTIAPGVHYMSKLSTSSFLIKGVKNPSASYAEYDTNIHFDKKRAHTIIESDVWIGDGAIIMSGVRLGVGCVIGANAVVTKNVLPYQIVGGVPARVISQRFSDDLIQKLIDTKWWESNCDLLNSLPLSNIYEFLKLYKFTPHEFPTYKLK